MIIVNNTLKRKRGRPRKNENVFTQKNNYVKSIPELTKVNSDIILEMPITLNDLRKYCPQENDDISETISTNANTKNKAPAHIFSFNEMSAHSPLLEYGETSNNTEYNKKLNLELSKEINKLKDIIETHGIYITNVTKAYEMPINLINIIDGKTIIHNKTNVACWWCSYNFDTIPCFIPEKYENDKYHVLGCFCSFNCATAYNYSYINDYKVGDRYSLLKKIYYEITGKYSEILSAPPKELLKKFGGTQTIEEYRNTMQMCIKEFVILFPPMTSLIPLIEEKILDGNKRKIYNNNLSNNFSGLRLKRNKPLPNSHNTLEDTLGLRIVTKQK
jgi:hypothetical protein